VDKLDSPVWSKPNQQAKTELCTHGGNNDFQTTLDVAAPHRVIASIIQSIETYLDSGMHQIYIASCRGFVPKFLGS
jgi:hypothetical protein